MLNSKLPVVPTREAVLSWPELLKMTSEETIKEIVEAIHAAFCGVSRGEITIHEAEVIDGYGPVTKRAAARRFDTDQCWEEVPDKHVEECPNALNHLDPQSWWYYLPRYMEWSLHNWRTTRSISVVHTIYSLLLTGDASLNDYLRARYHQLTLEQSQVVKRFLQFMAQDDERGDAVAAAEALQTFWGKFAPGTGPEPR